MTNFKQATKDLFDENKPRLTTAAVSVATLCAVYFAGKSRGHTTVELTFLNRNGEPVKLTSIED